MMFPYDYRQEQTLLSTLPLCYNEIPVRREMHTSGIAIFVPFTTKELFQDGQATYYGINMLSGNMIRANRSRLKTRTDLSSEHRAQARASALSVRSSTAF